MKELFAKVCGYFGKVARTRRREERTVVRMISELFSDPCVLKGTSLRPKHRARAVYVRHETQGRNIIRIRFGIIRHPRPYSFSRQVHEVAEYWDFDVTARELSRAGSVNLSRHKGTDGEPGAVGPGI